MTWTFQPLLEAAATPSSGINASLAVTLGACATSSAGTVINSGNESTGLAACVSAAAGTVLDTGVLSATLSNAVVASAGTISAQPGDMHLNVVLAGAVCVAFGAVKTQPYVVPHYRSDAYAPGYAAGAST